MDTLWHPFTQMKDCRRYPPILIESARGINLYDDRGRSYYDTISSWWCNVHGHNHPRINKAVKTQLDRLEHVLFAGFTHRPAIGLAQQLVSLAPRGLEKVFFSDNGSTAVEVALKMSFQYWRNLGDRRKKMFVGLDRGYHGDTIGAMSVGGPGRFNAVFEALKFSAWHVPSPYCYRCPMRKNRDNCAIECIEPLKDLLESRADEISGLILEPMVMAAGGMIVYPAEYLKKAAALAKKHRIHLILDEVATGFGRTGKMFASEHAGVSADFLCLSKGLTAGYLPLAATLTTRAVFKAFYGNPLEGRTFFHGHTFTANPLGCSAALASLKIFEEEKTLENMQGISVFFRRGLEEFRRFSHVGDVRSIGLIGALELVQDRKTKKPFAASRRIGFNIYKEGLKRGLILRPLGDIIYFFLPLCVKEEEIKDILKKSSRVLASV